MDTYDQVILSVTKTIYSNYLTVTINQDSENDFTRHLYAIPAALPSRGVLNFIFFDKNIAKLGICVGR